MKRWREAYQKHNYNATARYLHSVFKGRLKFIGVFRHTVIKSQNTCTTQLPLSIVYKCLFPKPNKIRNQTFIMLLL